MNGSIDLAVFYDRLRFWAICGTLCAGPSFLFAASSGFDRRAMVVGTGCYIVGFAVITALPRYQRDVAGSRLGRRLRLAAIIRASLAGFGLLGVGLGALGGNRDIAGAFAIFSVLDCLPGILAVLLTEVVSGQSLSRATEVGFGWTLMTTLVQGALVSAQLLVIALLSLLFPSRKRGNRLSEPRPEAPISP